MRKLNQREFAASSRDKTTRPLFPLLRFNRIALHLNDGQQH